MSETATSAPAPAGTPTPDSSTPAPSSQPGISISDAARLLNQQRREPRQSAEPAPTSKPAPSGQRAPPSASPALAAPAAPASPAADAGLSAMERALGVGGATPPAPANSNELLQDNTAAGLEIEGRRFTQAELREAVLKSADYTNKTQQLAQQRQALQAQHDALQTVLPYIQPELARLAQTVQQAPPRPDRALLDTDPTAFLRQQAEYDAAIEEQNRLGNLTVLQQQAQQRALEQAVAESNAKLAAQYPFWGDPQERAKAQNLIVEWATSKGGFSRDELRNLSSAHHLVALMKAAQFDKWVAGARTSAPPSALSAPVRGNAPPPAQSALVQQAQQAFQDRPTIKAGAALLAARRRGV